MPLYFLLVSVVIRGCCLLCLLALTWFPVLVGGRTFLYERACGMCVVPFAESQFLLLFGRYSVRPVKRPPPHGGAFVDAEQLFHQRLRQSS